MTVDLTVAICTYNGAKRVPEVLERLRQQTDTESCSWEILVIDNNSKDNTAQVVRDYQANWDKPYPIKYTFEQQQGLAHARQRAITESQGKYVGFLDDDNLAAPNWVAAAFAFGEANPQAGAYGSRIYPEYEVSPPENFQRISAFLALTDRGSSPRIYAPHKKILPPGAGLVIRKQVWLDKVPQQIFLQGRVGDSMLAGEDLEALLYIQQAGWEIWYNSEMIVHHQIPKTRLEKEYLLKLFRGIGLSRYRTRMLSFKPWQRPLALPAYMLNDLRKIIRHLLEYKTAVRDDIVAACELELYISSIQSPFFFWRKYFSKD